MKFRAFLMLLAVFYAGAVYSHLYDQGYGWVRFIPCALLGIFAEDIVGWLVRLHVGKSEGQK